MLHDLEPLSPPNPKLISQIRVMSFRMKMTISSNTFQFFHQMQRWSLPLGESSPPKQQLLEPLRLDFLVHKFHYVDPPHLLFVPKALNQTLELPKPESHLLIEAILPAISHNSGYVSDMPYVCFYWDFRLHRNPHLLITCPRSTFTFLFSTSTIAWNKVYKIIWVGFLGLVWCISKCNW